MIGWLRRLLGRRPRLTLDLPAREPQADPASVAASLAAASSAALLSEEGSRRMLELAAREAHLAPSKAAERRAKMEIEAPSGWHGPDFQAALESMQGLCDQEVAEAEKARDEALGDRDYYKRCVESEAAERKLLEERCNMQAGVLNHCRQALDAAKVPGASGVVNLDARILWLVHSRDRARKRARAR